MTELPPWSQPTLDERRPTRTRPDVDEMWHVGGSARPDPLVNERRRWILLLIPSIMLFGLLTRLGYLQAAQTDAYRDLVDRNQYRQVVLPAPRGVMTDRHGATVVDNAPNYSVTVIPAGLPRSEPEYRATIEQIATLTELDVPTVEERIENKKYSRSDAIPVLERIPYERALTLSIALADIPGTSITAFPTRAYRFGPSFAPIVGYIGPLTEADLQRFPQRLMTDKIGKSGLEYTYDALLSGTPGYVAYERTGQNVFLAPVTRKSPIPGNTLRLSIDAELQNRLQEKIRSMITSTKATGGAAVAIDPRNGDVLALVSEPTYDSNWFTSPEFKTEATEALTNPKRLLLNRAISGQYPSGSIVKPLIGAIALAENIVTPSTTIMSVGGFKVGPNTFPDWKAGGHGATNLAKAISESVNTYFYAIGGGYEKQPGLGVERIVRGLTNFGWGAVTGIELPNEADGFLPTKEWREKRASPWRLGDTYHISIGQGDVVVTPLQAAMSLASIANGGTLYQPRLVLEVTSSDGKVIKSNEPRIVQQQVVPADYVRAVQVGMRQGVLSGSSQSMQDLPVAVAGKTGTAEFGNEGKTHAWYTAYGPYEEPTIAIVVIIEGGGEGHAAALPVAKDALNWYFRRTPSN